MSKDTQDYHDGWIASNVIYFSLLASYLPFPPSVSQESKQQILQPLSVLRPKFRVNEQKTNSTVFISLTVPTGRRSIASRPRMINRFSRFSPLLMILPFLPFHRTLCSLKKPLNACCWIMTAYFQQWVFQLAYGDGLERSIKETASSQNLLVSKGTCYEM